MLFIKSFPYKSDKNFLLNNPKSYQQKIITIINDQKIFKLFLNQFLILFIIFSGFVPPPPPPLGN